jgi:DNA-binding beta-propeller fold protein YncE
MSCKISAVLLALWSGLRAANAYGEMNKFLIVSSSATHEVAYAPIKQDKMPGQVTLRTLISTGLTFPQGVAVDPWRRYLYVADPTLNKLVYYVLDPRGEDRLYVGPQLVAAQGVEVRWVTVDNLGNVYFTVESTHRVMRITAEKLDRGDTSAEVVFEGSKSSMVSAPGGIAMDNYFAYWTNKLNPNKAGTVVRSLHKPYSDTSELSKFDAKCYGVCMAVNNIFFTGETKKLYGIGRLGGSNATTISSAFDEPRGCAFDGLNTVYVADKKKNAVYSFSANMPTLRNNLPIKLTANMQGAYGVAVYTVSESAGAFALSPSLLASALLPALMALLAPVM